MSSTPTATTSDCTCRVHTLLNRWREALVIDTPEKEEAFGEIIDAWAHAEMDRDYLRAIMDGSWPSAREQLEAALARLPKEQP